MPKQLWSAEKVLEEIRSLGASGSDLRHGMVQKQDKRLVSAAIRYYGSWRAAVVAAGIDYEKLRESSEAMRLQKIGKWTCERITSDIRELVEQGEDLRAVMIKNKFPALFAAAVSAKYFGGWRQAVTAAGFDYEVVLSGSRRGRPKRGDIWHAGLIIDKIRDLTAQGVSLDSEHVSAEYPKLMRLATRRFGSWHAAIEEAAREQEPEDG